MYLLLFLLFIIIVFIIYLYTNEIDDFSNTNYDIINKNIVLITSKIIVSNNNFSYAEKRSIYTSEERYQQTLKTINSVRQMIPNSFIVLVDNSILPEDMITNIKLNTDCFINITDNIELNYNTDVNPIKAYAEISQQLCFYNYFIKKIDITKIKYFFKISGRYFINENFNYLQFDNENNIFKNNVDITNKIYNYTSFYKLNKNILPFYFTNLEKIINEKNIPEPNDLEVIIANMLKDKITLIDNLGLTQIISIYDLINNI